MVAGGKGGQADGRANRWLCRHCKTKGDMPYWNYPDKMACNKCHGSKNNVFLRDLVQGAPTQRTPAGEAARAAALQRKVAELEATVNNLKNDK